MWSSPWLDTVKPANCANHTSFWMLEKKYKVLLFACEANIATPPISGDASAAQGAS
jgi:hypothetical protein